MIYADNAATTKMSDAAAETMLYVIRESYGNPSSLYAVGQRAKEIVEDARRDIASAIGAEPREIVFTSGGSEADNQAILSAAELGKRSGKTHVISSAFEHHAVLHTLKKLEKQGFEITLLDVHEDGIVRPEEVEAAIREDTCLVTIMYANNVREQRDRHHTADQRDRRDMQKARGAVPHGRGPGGRSYPRKRSRR